MSILFTLKGELSEFKCDRRRSASFPDTAEITSYTYRPQKKDSTGEVTWKTCDSRCRCMQVVWFWGKKTADE